MNAVFKFIAITAPLLLLLSLPFNAKGEEVKGNSWDLWKRGFAAYSKAEELNLAENKLDALDKFKEALECFSKVKEKKPNWNKKIITYRIGLCKRKINSLQKEIKKLERAIPEPPPEPTIKGSASDKKKIAHLEQELEKYKSKLFSSVVELESLKREVEKSRINSSRNAKSSTQVEGLLKEKNELEKRYSLLLVKYDDLKKKTQAPESVQKELNDKLYEERLRFNALNEKNETLLNESKALKDESGKLKAQRTELNYNLKQKTDKLLELEAAEKSMILRLANLRKDSAELKTKIATLEKERKNFKELFDKKAEECELLYADIKKLRNNPNADEVTRQLNKENGDLRKENQLLTAKAENVSKNNNKLRKELTLSENKLKGLNTTLALVEKERKDLKVQIKKTQEELTKQTQEATGLRDKVGRLEISAQKSSLELNTFAEKYKELQNRFDSKDTLELKNFSFVKKNQELQEELKALKIKSAETEKQLAGMTESKTKLENNLNELTLRNKKILEDHAKLQTNHESLKKKIEDLQKEKTALLNVREHNKRLFAEANDSRNQLETLKKEILKAREDLKKKNKAVSELIAEVGNYKKLNKAQTDKIAKLENRIEKSNALSKKEIEKTEPANTAPQTPQLPADSIQVASNGDTGMPLSTRQNKAKNKYPVEKKDKEPVQNDEKLGLKNTMSTHEKKVDNDTIKFLIQSGKKSEDKKDLEAAVWHYKKAAQLDPENIEAQKLLGASYLKKGDYENAIKSLEKAKDLQDDNLEILLLLGKAYIASGKNRSALSVLNKAALIDKKNPDAQRYLGILCKNIGRKEFAEKKLRKSLEFDPKSPETMIELAKLLAFSFKGREVEAVELYEKALELGAKPDSQLDKLYKNPVVKNRSKKIKKEKPKPPPAQKKTELKQEKTNKDIKKVQETAKTGGKKKITQKVQERLDNETVEFLIKSAESAKKNKEFEKADWLYCKAAKVDPKNPLPFKKLAEMYSKLQNEYKTMKAYENSNKIFNGDTEVLLPLSSIYIRQGKYKEAINLLNTATIIDPKNPLTFRKLGEALRNIQKRELSEKSLLKSFELDPTSPETALLLAKLYTYTYKNRLNDGKKWYNKAKELGAEPDENLEAFYREK